MQVSLLKSKLHRVTVTAVEPNYSGSITIDEKLMEAAGFLIHEKVLVGNINNGERFETYAIPGEEGSGVIALNGAAAHKGSIGDLLVILSFVQLDHQEAKSWEPRVVIADEKNRASRKD
tara:strand:+ start:1215 stop:1571 length:357 start_codon:yes stop_codon:yes gene_type:complete